MQTYVLLAIALTLNALANVLIKAGMRNREPDATAGFVKEMVLNPYLWGGVTSFGLALAFYSVVLSRMPLSLAYPLMTTLGFVIVLGASAFLFDERLNVIQYAGIVLIAAGVWMAARG